MSRRLDLASLTQHHIDSWLAEPIGSHRRYLARDFLKWAVSKRLDPEERLHPGHQSRRTQNIRRFRGLHPATAALPARRGPCRPTSALPEH